MTWEELLELILATVDGVDAAFRQDDLAVWPANAAAQLERSGMLRQAANRAAVQCPNCDGSHAEAIEVVIDEGGRKRWFIPCPEALRVEIQPEATLAWEIDHYGLAYAVARALGIKGKPKAVVPERLWRLGRVPWKGKTREVVFARRLRDGDASSVAAHVARSGRTIVVVPRFEPDDRIWTGVVPPIVPLSRVSFFEGESLAVDTAAFVEFVAESDAEAERRSLLPMDDAVKKAVLARQVRAVLDGSLTDDLFMAALKQEGSVRKAAEFLTKELGRPISKDMVQRAARKAGGRMGLVRSEDSASVARTVASQPRDRAGKMSTYGK